MVFARYRYRIKSIHLSASHVKPDSERHQPDQPSRFGTPSAGTSGRSVPRGTGPGTPDKAVSARKPSPDDVSAGKATPQGISASAAAAGSREGTASRKPGRGSASPGGKQDPIPEVPLAEPRHLIPDSEKYAGMAIQLFVNGFTALFLLASLFDVLYAGEKMLILAGSRVVFVGLVWLVLYLVDEKGPLRYLPVHTALLVTLMHAFTAWILVPELPVNLYWSMAAFATLAAPLAVNWAQQQSLWQWVAGLMVTLITIYAVPTLELGTFLLQGGGFYLASLTAAVLLPAGWVPLQKRLARQRSTPVIRVEQPDEPEVAQPAVQSSRDAGAPEVTAEAYLQRTSDDETPGAVRDRSPGVVASPGAVPPASSVSIPDPGSSNAGTSDPRETKPRRVPASRPALFPDSAADAEPPQSADDSGESFGSADGDAAATSSKPRKFRHTAFADLFNQGGGAEPLTTSPLSLSDTLHSVLGSMQDLAASREVTLELIQPETNIWVAANLQGLHRALTGIVETLLRSTRETRFQVVLEVGNPYVDVHFALSRTGLSSGDPESIFAILDVLSRKLEPYTASISTAMFTAATLLSRMDGSLLHTRTGTEVEYARVRLRFNKETDA